MINKIKTFVKNISRNHEPFDASRFNDSVALQTEWNPAKSGGSNFRTHKLVSSDHHRMEFKPTLGTKLFSLIFVIVGIGVIVIYHIVGMENSDMDPFWEMVFIHVFGLLFFGAGAGMYYYMATPRVFDKYASMYWKGHKKPDYIYNIESSKNAVRFSDIHAIQLLAEYIRSDKSSYHSYELNLVLKNGERLNVVDHGSRSKLLEDARLLSEFLNKPIWDATS